jgi:CRP-like cAMP-binding protein
MEQARCILPDYGILTSEQIEFINKNSFEIRHRAGEIIFMQGRPVTHLIYVKSGLLKMYRELEVEREMILDIIPEQQYIGLTSIFYDALYPYSTASITNVELIHTSVITIKEIVAENGKYGLNLLTALSLRVVYLIERMIALTKKQVPGRIAEILLYFSKNIYKNNAFTLPLTRHEIADYVQTTKETVSRILTEFRNDRIIELDDKDVVLKSLDLLEILNKIG